MLKAIDLNLTLYTPDNKTLEFKHIKSVDNQYLANIKFSQNGEYKYIVKFITHIGGFPHYLRGEFKI